MARIARVEVGRRDYPLVGEFKFFKSGMRPTVVVRLTDDSGRQGYGQAVPVESWTYETLESVDSTLRPYLAQAVLGADLSDLADVHARMERAIRPSFSVGQPLTKAAIDGNELQALGSRDRSRRRPLPARPSIVGPSGCGKTAILNMVTGLQPYTSGSISIDGPHTDLGIVFQDAILLDWRNVLDNVLLQVDIRRLDRAQFEPVARSLLKATGPLTASRTTSRMSSRAACASALRSAGPWCTIRHCC